MSESTSVGDGGGAAVAGEQVPVFSRNATGLVRQVSLPQQIVFNLASSNALGLGLVFFLSVVVLFPRANIYVALLIAGAGSFFVWTTFALLTSAIPRAGGDYTINSRVMPPWLALGGNIGSFMGGLLRRADLRLLHGDARALPGARRDRRGRRLRPADALEHVLQQHAQERRLHHDARGHRAGQPALVPRHAPRHADRDRAARRSPRPAS